MLDEITEATAQAINLVIGEDPSSPIDWEQYSHCGLPVFRASGCEYAFAQSDNVADNAATEAIKESLWAFNSDFLAGETDLPSEVFAALSRDCESANDPILALVEKTCGLSSLVDSAIGADGRGHFLSPYDSDEIELENGCGYLYRIN
jgi:hypothetical protein